MSWNKPTKEKPTFTSLSFYTKIHGPSFRLFIPERTWVPTTFFRAWPCCCTGHSWSTSQCLDSLRYGWNVQSREWSLSHSCFGCVGIARVFLIVPTVVEVFLLTSWPLEIACLFRDFLLRLNSEFSKHPAPSSQQFQHNKSRNSNKFQVRKLANW